MLREEWGTHKGNGEGVLPGLGWWLALESCPACKSKWNSILGRVKNKTHGSVKGVVLKRGSSSWGGQRAEGMWAARLEKTNSLSI